MKKFKLGDTIRLKADGLTRRTYEVIPGPKGTPMEGISYGIRNDGGLAHTASPFVLGRPEEYKLVNRPSKKDIQIKRLQGLVAEAQRAERTSRDRARLAQSDADMQLLEAGLVRLDLLRTATTTQHEHFGDRNGEFVRINMRMEGDVIRQVIKRWLNG